MTYYIIGTGNVAWFLSKRLKEANHKCLGIYGRNRNEAQDLATIVDAPLIENLSDINDEADCCIIAIADKAISSVANELRLINTTVIHTAGSASIDLLNFQHKAVLWPIYSIVKNEDDGNRNIPFVYETSSEQSKEIVLNIAKSLSDIVYEANMEQRKWLHITAVFGNNFTNHLATLCQELCKMHHLPFSLIEPILLQTYERIINEKPFEMQTGPAKRNDETTINRQINELAIHPHLQHIYEAITSSIKDMYNPKEK